MVVENNNLGYIRMKNKQTNKQTNKPNETLRSRRLDYRRGKLTTTAVATASATAKEDAGRFESPM